MNQQELISLLGYRRDSPFKNNPYNVIHTKNGKIDMSATDIDLIGTDEFGNQIKMKKGTKKPYQFKGKVIHETPDPDILDYDFDQMQTGGSHLPKINFPGNKTDSYVAPLLDLDILHKQDILKKQNNQPQLKQGYVETKQQKVARDLKNQQYKQQNPYTQIDQNNDLSTIDPDRNMQGLPVSPNAKRFDKGLDHFMGAIDAATYVTGAGELASLAKSTLKKSVVKSIPTSSQEVLSSYSGMDAVNARVPGYNSHLFRKQGYVPPESNPALMAKERIDWNGVNNDNISNWFNKKEAKSFTADPEATMFTDETGYPIYKLDPEDYKNFETKKMYDEALKDTRDYKKDFFKNKFKDNSEDIFLKSIVNKQDYSFLHSKLNNEGISKNISQEISKRYGVGTQAVSELGLNKTTNKFSGIHTLSDDLANQNIIKKYNPNTAFGYNNFTDDQLHQRFLKSIDDVTVSNNKFLSSLPKNKKGGMFNPYQDGGEVEEEEVYEEPIEDHPEEQFFSPEGSEQEHQMGMDMVMGEEEGVSTAGNPYAASSYGASMAPKLFPTVNKSSTPSADTSSSSYTSGNKANYAFHYLMDKGLSREQSAGVVANLIQESGNFRDDVISDETTGDNNLKDKAHGVAQWRADRYRNLIEYSKSTGKNYASLDAQLDFIVHEAQQRKFGSKLGSDWDRLKNTNSVKEATRSFNENFEVSHDSQEKGFEYWRTKHVLDKDGNLKLK